MYPYHPDFLEYAAQHLGEMYEYAVYNLGFDIDRIQQLFIESGVAHDFAVGDIEFIAGMDGSQMCRHILWKCGINYKDDEEYRRPGYSHEYWAGYIAAKFQWRTCKQFEEIHNYIPMSRFVQLYDAYHTVSDSQALDEIGDIFLAEKYPEDHDDVIQCP